MFYKRAIKTGLMESFTYAEIILLVIPLRIADVNMNYIWMEIVIY